MEEREMSRQEISEEGVQKLEWLNKMILRKESEPCWVRRALEGGPRDQLGKEITWVGQ